MSDRIVPTRALLSVSDKTGIVAFAKGLQALGVELVSTGGTASLLKEQGLPVRDVAELTGFPEMMDGRVKTLHPGVHGGLLARRTDAAHMAQADAHNIAMIDLLVVTLYPFEATLSKTTDYDTLVENIDIGGPAMIRAAAKNHESVTVVVDPADYDAMLKALTQGGIDATQRKQLAAKAFARTASYDTLIASWMASASHSESAWPAYLLDAEFSNALRYGENPHQSAALYRRLESQGGIANATPLQGKELSYNNLQDGQAAWDIVSALSKPAVALIKHANPCGVAIADSNGQAFARALASDPVSAFGGILATNRPIDGAFVEALGSLFLEVILAPRIEEDARALLAAKKNLRVLEIGPCRDASPLSRWMIREISGGYLVQQQDKLDFDFNAWKPANDIPISEAHRADAALAFEVVRTVKSNAIVLVKNGATIGIGAGQMSRVDSVRIAIEKARQHGHEVKGAVLASDAFLPFADNVELAATAGISVIVQPGGSMRDAEVFAAAAKSGIAMLLTGSRHFKH